MKIMEKQFDNFMFVSDRKIKLDGKMNEQFLLHVLSYEAFPRTVLTNLPQVIDILSFYITPILSNISLLLFVGQLVKNFGKTMN